VTSLEDAIAELVRKEVARQLAERDANSEWLTAFEAAEILGVHPKTLRKMIRDGKLASSRVGSRHRVLRADVEQLIKGARNDNLTPEQLARRKFG
jgi:excisionase family DNA binding protein